MTKAKNRRTKLIGDDGVVRGDSFTFKITCFQEDGETPLDLTDFDDLTFEVSREEKGLNVIEKALGSGISIEGDSNERAIITLGASDTAPLDPRVYRWELTCVSSLETVTPAYGSIEVLYSSS